MDDRIDLADAIEALRGQLADAAAKGEHGAIRFPVEGIELEFQVGATRTGEGHAGIRFWVVELGGGGSYTSEAINVVRVKLGEPENADGTPVKVAQRTGRSKP